MLARQPITSLETAGCIKGKGMLWLVKRHEVVMATFLELSFPIAVILLSVWAIVSPLVDWDPLADRTYVAYPNHVYYLANRPAAAESPDDEGTGVREGAWRDRAAVPVTVVPQ